MTELEITPHQDGRRRLLDQDQFQRIQKAVSSKEKSASHQKVRKTQVSVTHQINASQVEVLSLKKRVELLTLEKSDLLKTLELEKQISQRTEQMIGSLSEDIQTLRREVEGLLLHNSAPNKSNADIPTPSPIDHVTPQEMEVIQLDMNEPTRRDKEKSSFGIGLSVIAACVFLFWLAITSEEGSQWLPSMQERVTKALQISESSH
jgi:5'-3' exonuclease